MSESYRLPGLPVEEVPAGTNLLVAGPPMTGKQQLVMDLVEEGCERDEGALVVSCRDGADRILSEHDRLETAVTEGRAGIVDCVTRQRGDDVRDREFVRYVSSPGDVTDIGIRINGLLQSLSSRPISGLRSTVVSIPTILMYEDSRRVFRFLHVLNGRIHSRGYLGFAIIELSDREVFDTFAPLYDGMIQVRENERGERELRVAGLESEPTDWRPY